MTYRRHDARAPHAPGRFVRFRAGALAALVILAGCASGGGPPAGATVPAFPDPILEPGRIAPAAEARAAELLLEAEAALAAGDAERAEAAAREVVERFPSAPVSGRALWVLAQATRAAGDLREADGHAQRWARLLEPGDPRLVEARLLQGSALVVAGEGEGAIRRLLALPPGASVEAREAALGLARSGAALLEAPALAALAEETPPDHPFAPVLHSARARLLYNEGEEEAARAAAEAALAAGALPPEAGVARGILDRRVDASLGLTGPRALLGSILPVGGSPALREYATLVEEGVRAAVSTARITGRLDLEVLDGLGTPAASAAAARDLAAAGAAAVVGPLQAEALAAAAQARAAPVPMISPTAPAVPLGAPHVYTLLGPDPAASRSLARWAVGAGIRRVVVVHSLDASSRDEAESFGEAFRAAGGAVLRTEAYPPGTMDFSGVVQAAAELRPDALVLPVPPEDVGVLAPQLTFFGLDTLGIHLLGTGAWTERQVLRSVSSRHLDGVVAASPERPSETESAGYRRFVEAYEATHRKTLRSPVPALGWDAASLLLEALATGARSPDDVARALEGVDGFQGATGVLSFEEGRVVRRHHLVCLRSGALLPVPEGVPPSVFDRRPPADTLTGQRPVPVGLPIVRVCPGEAPPEDGVPLGSDPFGASGALPRDTLRTPPPPRGRRRAPRTPSPHRSRLPS